MSNDDDHLQISLLLKGDDARRFREFKASERLMKDAEAGRKLILDRLAEIDASASIELPPRRPMVRAMSKSEAKQLVLETMREALENAG